MNKTIKAVADPKVAQTEITGPVETVASRVRASEGPISSSDRHITRGSFRGIVIPITAIEALSLWDMAYFVILAAKLNSR